MSYIVTGMDFERLPDGEYDAVCFAFVPLGEQKTKFGVKKQVRFGFEVDARYTKGEYTGKRFTVWSRPMTANLSTGSALRDFVEWWIGRKFPIDRSPQYDLETLVGKCAKITVKNEKVGEKDYTNIVSIGSPTKKIEMENFGYLPEWIKKQVDNRVDKPGQQLDITDEFYDDPNKALADAANSDIGAEGGIDYRTLSNDDVPFKQGGGNIPY